MATGLTNLVAAAYLALDQVSRELVGFIPAVGRDSTADRLALGQTAYSHKTPKNTAGKDIVPGMSLPTAAEQNIGNIPVTIQKSRAFPFSWTGVDQRKANTGVGYLSIRDNQIAQAIRAAVNEIETDLGVCAALAASRASGTAGSTPFATNLADPAKTRKILDDNGVPASDRHLVINTTAGAAIRTLGQLTKANEANDDSLLRQGVLLDVHGFAIRESAQVSTPAVGTAASATTSTAALAKGVTSIPLAAAGTGTILAGDVITIQDDPNQYVVVTGTGAVSGATITIQEPGLQKAKPASAKAVTVLASSARNVAFQRNALLLATALPEMPEEGDMAILRETLVDDRSGLVFELAVYPGYKMMHCEIGINWGVNAIKPEHIALLLGEG